MEAALGLRYFFDGAFLQGGAGTGLFPDYGTPAYRVFVGAGYYQRTPYDRDEDGIPNRDDLCVDDPETINGFEDSDGCPDVRPVPQDDQDEDGILNDVDECPELPEDKDQFEDEDGCPDSDNDKDGLSDKRDECPNQAEDRDGWEDGDGCPEEDNDEDGINDTEDDCPNDPETLNDIDDEDGCPDGDNVKVVVKRGAVEIKEKVFFESNSSNIMSKSFALLNDVAAVLNQHVYIKKILVGGHTDSTGDDKYNLELSEQRAHSVRTYLIGAGVAEERLDAQGFGETEPLVSNKNKQGRETNRRVEFNITNDGVEEAPVIEEPEAIKDEVPSSEEEGEAEEASSEEMPPSEEETPDTPKVSEEQPEVKAPTAEDEMPQGDE
jgi:outer membrane protein OmpA-like peptidoglycan-associated protein